MLGVAPGVVLPDGVDVGSVELLVDDPLVPLIPDELPTPLPVAAEPLLDPVPVAPLDMLPVLPEVPVDPKPEVPLELVPELVPALVLLPLLMPLLLVVVSGVSDERRWQPPNAVSKTAATTKVLVIFVDVVMVIPF